MAYTYSSLYGLKTTGLRFFKNYGPWSRMEVGFAQKLTSKGSCIELYNFGNMTREFNYIEDTVEIVSRLIFQPIQPFEPTPPF